jgi:murein L,D-transpeptidase YcbB/YkuD
LADVEKDSKAPDGVVTGGGRVTIGCKSGCAEPGADVDVYAASTPVKLATVTADSVGGYDVVVQLPADLLAGTHHVIAGTTDASGRRVFYANALTVVATSTVKAAPRLACPASNPTDKSAAGVAAFEARKGACAKQAAAARLFYRGTPFPGKALRRGSAGSAVLKVQQALGVAESSRYDASLRKAVKAFQKANKLKVTGAVHKATWTVLFT